MRNLPLWLIRDIQNFIKLKDPQKFLWQDMTYFEIIHDYQIQTNLMGNQDEVGFKSLEEQYSHILDLYESNQDVK